MSNKKLGALPNNVDLRDSTRARTATAKATVQLAAVVTLFRLLQYNEQPDTVLTQHEANELIRLTKWWTEFGEVQQVRLLDMARHLCTEVETVSQVIVAQGGRA
jgi:hypothetical protein